MRPRRWAAGWLGTLFALGLGAVPNPAIATHTNQLEERSGVWIHRGTDHEAGFGLAPAPEQTPRLARPAGSTAELSSSSAAGARLMPDVEGSYVAELVVDDGFELSRPDSVTITVVEPQSVRGLTPPPQLVNPTIIKDRCPGTLEFGADEDVLILMPKDKVCKGAMRIDGGRNVRVVGGHFIYTGPGHRGGDKAVIRYGNITDTIFFEGLNLDVNGVEMDAINNFGPGNAVNSPTKVYVQNSYIHGVNGRRDTVHGDIMEAFAGVDWVVFENVSAFSGSAGLFLPRRPENDIPGATRPVKLGPRNIRLHSVHLGVDTSIVGVEPGAEVTRLLYLHDSKVAGTTHDATHDLVTLENVYVDGQPDRPFWKMIMPTPGTRPAGSIRSADGKSVTFPPEMNIRGQVREGPPPGGTFVNPRDVGLNFTSPHGLPAQ